MTRIEGKEKQSLTSFTTKFKGHQESIVKDKKKPNSIWALEDRECILILKFAKTKEIINNSKSAL